MFLSSLDTMTRTANHLILTLALAIAVICTSGGAHAHFSYSDPRVIHVAEHDQGGSIVLVRMPAPLALLPEDWSGKEDTRTPAFAMDADGVYLLDPAAILRDDAALRERLSQAVIFWAGGQRVETRVEQFRFWNDRTRPGFGTLKSAIRAFDMVPDPAGIAPLPYFDLTLDVKIHIPRASLSDDLRLQSDLGQRFQVIEKLGTIVKLHRENTTETRVGMGVLDVSFPRIVTAFDILLQAALTGAEHIYRGLDHLAMILLISIAARNWRQALSWASAFTLGHVITLAAGLYGFAPTEGWFVPTVELAIAMSIVAAGVAISLRWQHGLGWTSLLIIGFIHGYGFAASASEALFAGSVDPLALAAFALGLEFCQLTVYALVLPILLLIDRICSVAFPRWRHGVALGIAVMAVSAVIMRLSDALNAFGFA